MTSQPISFVPFLQGVTAEDFNSAFSETRFIIAGSDAKEYDLIPGGKDKPLTWENRKAGFNSLSLISIT